MPKPEPTNKHKDLKEEIHKLGGKLASELRHLKEKYDTMDAKNKKRLHNGLAAITAILVAVAIKGQRKRKK